MNAGELVISLLLDGNEFQQDVADAQRDVDDLGRAGADAMHRTEKAAHEAGEALKDAGEGGKKSWSDFAGVALKVVGVLGGIAAFKGALNTYLSEADALGKYSDALGVNIVEVQAWQEAVMHAGGSADEFKNTLSGLTANLVQAAETGKGRMIPFFEALGLSVKDATGKAKSAMDVLPELAEKFEGMSKSEAMGWGQKLGLDHGTIMLLQSGKKAVLEAIAAGKEFAVYNEKDAKAAADVNDAIQDMQAAFKGVTTMIVRWVAPAFKTFADILTRVAQWIRKNEPLIIAMFVALGAVLMKTAVPAMLRLAATTAAALAPYLAMAAAIAAVGLALEDLWVFIQGGDSAFEDLLNSMGLTKDQIETVRAALQAVWDVLGLVWDLMKAVFSMDGAAIGAAWDALYEKISSIGEAVKAFFASMWDSVLGKIDDVWKAIASFFGRIKGIITDLLPDWVKKLIGADSAEGQPAADKKAAQDFHASLSGFENMEPQVLEVPQNVDNSTTATTNINGPITVQTQATDANGVAAGLGGALRKQSNMLNANTGVRQ